MEKSGSNTRLTILHTLGYCWLQMKGQYQRQFAVVAAALALETMRLVGHCPP